MLFFTQWPTTVCHLIMQLLRARKDAGDEVRIIFKCIWRHTNNYFDWRRCFHSINAFGSFGLTQHCLQITDEVQQIAYVTALSVAHNKRRDRNRPIKVAPYWAEEFPEQFELEVRNVPWLPARTIHSC